MLRYGIEIFARRAQEKWRGYYGSGSSRDSSSQSRKGAIEIAPMNEWLATVGVLVAIFATGAGGMGWLRRKVAVVKKRRAHERHLDSVGEIERLAYVYADQGASPREIAKMLEVRMSSVRSVLPEDYLRQFSRSGRHRK